VIGSSKEFIGWTDKVISGPAELAMPVYKEWIVLP
jgi:hypothetical protein